MGTCLHIAWAPRRACAVRPSEPLSFLGQPTDELTVISWMPAATLYFRDPDGHPDGHLLGYLAMLDEPYRAIEGSRAPPARRSPAGIVPWSGWRAS